MTAPRKYGLWRSRPVAFALRLFAGLIAVGGLIAMFQELFEFGADEPPASLSQER